MEQPDPVTANGNPTETGTTAESAGLTSGPPGASSRRTRFSVIIAAAALLAFAGLGAVGLLWNRGGTGPAAPAELGVAVQRRLPHDSDAFTQGLELVDGQVLESTGRYGQSTARRWDLETGAQIGQVGVPQEFFAEGITALPDGRVVQLTWKEGTALIRASDTLAEVDRVSYEGEGWGICFDETYDRLVMSDGSARLTFRNSETFAVEGSIDVIDDDQQPVDQLNELECADGRVWANVWQTDTIVAIDPDDGSLDATVDASGLLTDEERADADVLNGIAALPDGSFLITGKLWPAAFVVDFVPTEETR